MEEYRLQEDIPLPAAFRELTRSLLKAKSLEELGEATLSKLRVMMPYQQASLARFDFNANEARLVAAEFHGTSLTAGGRVPLASIDSLATLRRGQPHLVSEASDRAGAPEDDRAQGAGVRSYLVVPIVADGELLGSLNLGSAQAGAFGEDEIKVVQEVAGLLSVAILAVEERTRLSRRLADLEMSLARRAESLEQQYRRKAALAEIELAINQPAELEGVMDRIVEVTTQLLPATGGASVILWDAEAQEFYIRSFSAPGQTTQTVFERVRRQEGATRWIVDHCEPLIVPDVNVGSYGTTGMLAELGYQAYAGVPLVVEGEVLGVLYAVDELPRQYAQADIEFLTALANRAAVAVSKVNLYERLREANQMLARQSRELELANQDLKDFAYIISHDLKAPLRGINTLAGWLLADHGSRLNEEGRKLVGLLIRRVKRMHDLIDGVLHYSRAGRSQGEWVRIQLDETLTEVLDSINPPPEISVQIETSLPVISAESTQIRQVFQNLLSNAVRYVGQEGGQVRIGCVEQQDAWKFYISDDGPGIDQADHEKIFKPFQTASASVDAESTGIGLAVVKKIVESGGGKVWIDSQVGSGSTFYFTWPKERPAENPP